MGLRDQSQVWQQEPLPSNHLTSPPAHFSSFSWCQLGVGGLSVTKGLHAHSLVQGASELLVVVHFLVHLVQPLRQVWLRCSFSCTTKGYPGYLNRFRTGASWPSQ